MNQRTKLASALLAFALVFSLTAWSQEAQPSQPAQASASSYKQSPERYFRLNFRVLDVSPEGKVVNSRLYHEMVASGPKSDRSSSIRTGDRIPIVSGSAGASNVQFQYIDTGTNIDVEHAEIVDRTLRLEVKVSISSFSTSDSSSYMPAGMKEPIIRQVSWNSYVTVPINQPTVIFSADNNADKGKTELELTAVPISQ
ncbi:MAG: hypothetical protein WBD10_12855 [Acidobacteriaceae bacterium]